MGAWGVSIFADDLAVDIKDEYLALLVKYCLLYTSRCV